jgi:hypothetical protein
VGGRFPEKFTRKRKSRTLKKISKFTNYLIKKNNGNRTARRRRASYTS